MGFVSVLQTVANLLGEYKYLAMFGILFLCGVGLPLPEEVTLIASGLAVSWYDANFFVASAVCVSAILAGDSVIYFLGRHYGRAFLNSRPMQWILKRRTQRKVDILFRKHGQKAVFFARFFAVVRIGVYAYAGKNRMPWPKFIFLDLLGAVISGPTSIALGWWASRKLARNSEEGIERAAKFVEEFKVSIWIGLSLVALFFVVRFLLRRRRERELPESIVVVDSTADGGTEQR